ncbi:MULTISPECIES: glycoside hydrolase family 32 protein [unclassified Luteococcus]|uniref:glycoside hydrolase family 32 protein n=1 Tax=unclassified Luteococcus TaxID=2639923 RepID=UPI00313B0508
MNPDVCLPTRHIRPAQGWINDPNGLVFHDGRWHVFFQFNPDEPRHGQIHWGHVSSDDLLTWREEPIALRPRPGTLDAVGCWSGCCTLDAGLPTFCYTAVDTTPADAVGAIATGSADLTAWAQTESPSAARVGVAVAETRDPFVVWIEGRRYIVQGHGGPGVPAEVLVYDATDLADWKLLGPLVDGSDPVAVEFAAADIWECPNLVQVDGEWVLILSLWRHDGTQGQLSGVRWLVGDVAVTDGCPRFIARDGGVLDDGPAFYAPQVLLDRDAGGNDRVLLIGWSWELGRDDAWLAEHGWAGVLTVPRELHVRDGRLVMEPAPEVLTAAGESLGESWPAGDGAVLVTTSGPGTLVCSDPDGPGEVEIPGAATVIVDGSILEVFHGGSCFTTRIYAREASVWSVRADEATVRRL